MISMAGVGFRPLVCADLELSDPQRPLEIPAGSGLQFVVRLHAEPIGELVIEPDDVAGGPSAWCQAACQELRDEVAAHLTADGVTLSCALAAACREPISSCSRRLEVTGIAPSAVLAVCTIGKHPLLRDSVRALLAQDYEGAFSVVVIDNAPSSGGAAAAVAKIGDPRLRLVAAPIPGLSFARNAALRAAFETGADVICYTDDDALVDPDWLRGKAAVFSADLAVACVTGLIVPGSLASAAEQFFEDGSGFNKGYQRKVWSRAAPESSVWRLGPKGDGGALFPFSAGLFGSGNSMSFRTKALQALGGFDEALGAGTATQGGEDLDIFLRVIMSGGTIIYEPTAMVRHFHRETFDELHRQMANYGSGLSAYLFREFLHLRGAKVALLRAVPRGLWRMFASGSDKNKSRTSEYPRELVKAEHQGFVKGPWLYLRARRAAKRLAGFTSTGSGR